GDGHCDLDGDGIITDEEIALCGPPPGDGHCDLDGDGIITDEEIALCGPPPGDEHCDLDGDGIISAEEIALCGTPPPLSPCDVDGDGFLSDTELDLNGDGIVDETEKQECAPPIDAGHCDLDGDGIITDEELALCGTPPPLSPCDIDGDGFLSDTELDLNGDGIVDETEQEDCGPPPFDEFCDLDGDGFLSAEELDLCGPPLPTFEEWQGSASEADIDGSGFIDAVDYEAYLWIDGEGDDLDGSGDIDYDDFVLFLLSGDATTGEIVASPITIDLDPEPGDQERQLGGNARTGTEYTLQFNIGDTPAIRGWSVTLNYDPAQLTAVGGSFELTDYIEGGLPLVRGSPGEAGIGTTVLTGDASGSGAGTLGSVKLRVLEGFTGSTDIEMVRYGVRPVDGEQVFESVSVVITISDMQLGEAPPGDFDGDGLVDFPDFFLFADAFWTASEEFDLTGDGFVDFRDFFLFADYFGQRAPLFKLMALAQDVLGLPTQAQLQPNYPNPFNSSTMIAFAIPRPSDVQLRIYDILGQRVRSLDPGETVSGFHRVAWNGRDDQQRPVAAGVYVVRLVVESHDGRRTVDVRKMTLAE
ncbi:MAG: T9SS type A sorting domain-containing protein, partial [Gemmatimonadetes bacterium]|nr:T9SS type A sorting domain-containing protein [Gemmatimonadota bacterium]